MPRDKGPETFAPYYAYLDEDRVWPSDDGRGDLAFDRIDEMHPRHAASCLAKLVRWARQPVTAAHLNIHDADRREQHVRDSLLGKRLAAAALGLEEAAEEILDVVTVDERELVLAILAAINVPPNDKTPDIVRDLGLVPATRIAIAIAGKLHATYNITERQHV